MHLQDLVRRLPQSTFVDLSTQPDIPWNAWEDGVPDLNSKRSTMARSGHSKHDLQPAEDWSWSNRVDPLNLETKC